MLYYHCSGSLQLLPPPSNPSTSLQEFIKLERSHESSFRAWNQDFLATNVAMDSWALSETNDRTTLEVLTQVSKLLTNSASAQTQYATALADYRACLKYTQRKETELELIKRDREVLLRRFLKLNRKTPITPSNNLDFRIKLDDAKRELSNCQKALRTAADELYESKQNCLRGALRAKLTKFEDLGQAMKLNAHQAIQLLNRILPDRHSSETESNFHSCDQDSIREPTPLTPSQINHDHNSWPVRSHAKREDAVNAPDIESPRPSSALGNQRDDPLNRPHASNPPTGLHIYRGTRHPIHLKQPIVPGTALMPPPRILVKKRHSLQSKPAHLRSQARTTQLSPPPNISRAHHRNAPSRLGRTHVRQRSRSLEVQPSFNTLSREVPKPRKLIRPSSYRSQPSRIIPNSVAVRSLNHLPLNQPVPTESVGPFKFSPKGMISKLGKIRKWKDDKVMLAYSKSGQNGDGKTAEVQSLPTSQDQSFWPTIQPLSVYSDTCSDDSLSDDEQCGGMFPSEDLTGGLEHPIPSNQTLRAGIQPTRRANQHSNEEALPTNAKSIRSNRRPTSWNHIPKQTRRNSRAQRTGRMHARRKARSIRSEEESHDSDDRSAQITLNEELTNTGGVKLGPSHAEQEKKMTAPPKNSPLSWIKEYDGSSLSEIGGKKSSSPFDLPNQYQHHRHHLKKSKKSSIISVDENHSSYYQKANFNESQQQEENVGKSSDEMFHSPTLQDDTVESHLQSNTQKAMGDIKAKFFALGMQPST